MHSPIRRPAPNRLRSLKVATARAWPRTLAMPSLPCGLRPQRQPPPNRVPCNPPTQRLPIRKRPCKPQRLPFRRTHPSLCRSRPPNPRSRCRYRAHQPRLPPHSFRADTTRVHRIRATRIGTTKIKPRNARPPSRARARWPNLLRTRRSRLLAHKRPARHRKTAPRSWRRAAPR
jgi:hypothetical protein